MSNPLELLIMDIKRDPPKVTIEELERILSSGERPDIEIQPDGSIRAVPAGTAVNADIKPITFKYAVAEYF